MENMNIYSKLLMILMVFICILGACLMILPLFLKDNKKKEEEKELTDEEIKKIDKNLDKEKLKNEIFTLYKKTEVAKSKFDYETLKMNLIEELYNEEEKKLQELKKEKQKLVATNIKLQELKILSINIENKKTKITAYLHISQYDYVVDNKKNIIRGTDESEYQIEYKISLEKNENLQIVSKECIGKWIKNK